MAQELYLLRDVNSVAVNILDNPITTITDFTVSISHMGDNKLTAEFYYPKRIDFQLNEYVIYEKEGAYAEGDPNATERYYLITPPTWEKTETSLMLKYTCDLVSKAEILKYISMIDSWEGIADGETPKKPSLFQTEYSFFGGVEAYFINIKSSMIAEFGSETIEGVIQPRGWTLELDLENGYPQDGEDMSITVSNTNVFSALQDINEKFKVPFFINNTSIIVGGVKSYVEHKFRYGKGNGLYKLNKSILSNDIITKIRGVGSEKNLPYNYLQSEKAAAGLAGLPMSKLMPYVYRSSLLGVACGISAASAISDYYVAADAYNPEFPRLSFETFDDIYPTIKEAEYSSHRIDKIKGVYFESSAVNIENETVVNDESEEIKNPRFWIKIPALGFDLKEQLNEKDKLVLSPTTGYCGGCKFNVLSIGSRNSKWDGYKTSTYNDSSLMIVPRHVNELYAPNTVEMSVESNRIKMYSGCTLDYSISPLIYAAKIIDNENTITIDIDVDLYKGDTVIQSLYSNSYSLSGNDSINEQPTIEDIYVVGDDIDPDDYYIKITTVITMDGESENWYTIGQASIVIPETQNTVTYSIEPEAANDTTDVDTWLYVQKDIDSYNTLMPYPIAPMWTNYASPDAWEAGSASPSHVAPTGLVPAVDDEYVFLGITLPQQYIIEAEQRLETALLLALDNNKTYKYKYDCGFDEKMLMENPSINSDVKIGSVMRIYESIDPSETVDTEDYEEMVINSLTLKYSADKTVPTQTGG